LHRIEILNERKNMTTDGVLLINQYNTIVLISAAFVATGTVLIVFRFAK